jgi:DNA-binding transcriptional ArsR family regulator
MATKTKDKPARTKKTTTTATVLDESKPVAATEPQVSYGNVALSRAAFTLKMAADPTRLGIALSLLEAGTLHVGALWDAMAISQPAVSHHLSLMRHGGFVMPTRKGKHILYELTDKGRTLAKMVKNMIDQDV